MNFGLKSIIFSCFGSGITLVSLLLPTIAKAQPPQSFSHAQTPQPTPLLIAQASRTVSGSPATGRSVGGGTELIDLTYDASRSVSGAGAGGRAQGGGVRGKKTAFCPTPEVPLTALVPFTATYPEGKTIPITMNVWGTTTQAHPTLWAYVPPLDPSIELQFLLTEGRNLVHRTTLQAPGQGGVIAIPIPTTATALTPDKQYQWTLSFRCKAPTTGQTTGSSAQIETVYIQASVFYKPLDSAIANQLTPTPSRQNAALYAQNGFWYDALTTLATLRQQAPEDPTLQADWATLLKSMVLSPEAREHIDIDTLAKQPLAR